jgi:hypothetical protein
LPKNGVSLSPSLWSMFSSQGPVARRARQFCHSSQPVRSPPLFASRPPKAPGCAPLPGYHSVSASRIERRKRRSHHLSPKGIFHVSFLWSCVSVKRTSATQCWAMSELSFCSGRYRSTLGLGIHADPDNNVAYLQIAISALPAKVYQGRLSAVETIGVFADVRVPHDRGDQIVVKFCERHQRAPLIQSSIFFLDGPLAIARKSHSGDFSCLRQQAPNQPTSRSTVRESDDRV